MALAARRGSLSSRYVTTYNRLFSGLSPEQISPNHSPAKFWSDLLELIVEPDFLSERLTEISNEDCLGKVKPMLNALVSTCIDHARTSSAGDPKKFNAVETLSILGRCIFKKNLAGWEIMEVFAGGVQESDTVFNGLTAMIDEILNDAVAPVNLRHQVLQLAVIYVSGISQLSPGAYFLRRDLFPCIVQVIISPETRSFTFEAVLLLSLLANFHKSDAAKLNPYLTRIRETNNPELMRNICWAANFAADAVIKSYQAISDDSPQAFGMSFGSFLSVLRVDKALSSTPIDLPKELFKNQPIEACVILLPIFEFLSLNEKFCAIFIQAIQPQGEAATAKIAPLPYTLLTLMSYILTHASSVHAPRAIAYAQLSLSILFVFVESKVIMSAFCQTTDADIRLCRQRLPLLPTITGRAPVCALLDCCVLWLRHNLHKRLEVYAYIKCIRVCYRSLWFLQREHIRIEYHWQELWRALIGLLDFLAVKLDSLITTGGIEQLVQESIFLLDLALCHSGTILHNATAVHELVYEIVRSASVFKKQQMLLDKLALPRTHRRASFSLDNHPRESLANIISMADHYGGEVQDAGATSARSALRVVAKKIEADGLAYGKDLHAEEPPKQSDDVVGFTRYAYMDCVSLMP